MNSINYLLLTCCKHGNYGTCKKCDPETWEKVQKYMNRTFTQEEIKEFKNKFNKLTRKK